MTTLAERDKLISHLQSQINGYKAFLGGGKTKLTEEESNKLRTLESYLKDNGRGGEKDFATINSLLNEK
jgi:hypothetical protein